MVVGMQISLSVHNRNGILMIDPFWTETEFDEYFSEFCSRLEMRKIEANELLAIAKKIQ